MGKGEPCKNINEKYRLEILEILESIKGYLENDKNSRPRLYKFISFYIEEYSEPEPPYITDEILLLKCYGLDDGSNKARVYMGEFRQFLIEFFKTEGKFLKFKITIPKGQYLLKLENNENYHQSNKELRPPEGIQKSQSLQTSPRPPVIVAR